MTLGNLAEVLPEDSLDLRTHLNEARAFAEDAVREIRLVSYLMYPPLLDDAGVGPALSWYVRGFSQRSVIHANLEVPADFGRCPQEIENTIFAVVQESLTNTHRYSGSASVDVLLVRQEDSVRIEIQDHGCGLPLMTRGNETSPGVGIAGMRERVKQLQGSFDVLSTPGQGTLVRAVIPCSKDSVVEFSQLSTDQVSS
jgi:two-component system NarL family sensor kinase